LIGSYDSVKSGRSLPKLESYTISKETNKLPFIIKRYPFRKGFSPFIHDSNDVEYDIAGPIVIENIFFYFFISILLREEAWN
jgi:hypothetical protein